MLVRNSCRRENFVWLALLLAVSLVVFRPAAARGFVIHAHAFMDEQKATAVKLTAEIPFTHLVFIKLESRSC